MPRSMTPFQGVQIQDQPKHQQKEDNYEKKNKRKTLKKTTPQNVIKQEKKK
jgi:hypothetical protein